MEFLFLLPILMTLYLFGYGAVYRPFVDGTRMIDPITNPTLARTQRILRARNTKAREKELKALESLRNERQTRAISEMKAQHEKDKAEDQAHHQKLIKFWDGMFLEARAKEIEQERLDAIEKKRLEAAAFEERRVRELAMWEESEKKRIKEFAEKVRIQNELDDLEKKRVWGELEAKKKELEQYHQRAQIYGTDNLVAAGGLRAPTETRYDIEYGSYGDRYISLHGVYVRSQANRKSKILNNLEQNFRISVDGWTVGEELYGNPIWFHQKPGGDSLAGWVWSGAVSNKSTSGLPRMSDEIKLNRDWGRFSQNSENAFEGLAEMHSDPKYQIQLEIAELTSEIQALNERIWPSSPPPPSFAGATFRTGGNTITAGMITANKLYVHSSEKFRTMDQVREAINHLDHLSAEDLTALQGKIKTKFGNISDDMGDGPITVDAVETMTELADYNDAVQEEQLRRDSSSLMFHTRRHVREIGQTVVH